MSNMNTLGDFRKGMRVTGHRWADPGTVTLIGRKYVHVRLRTGQVRRFLPADIRPVRNFSAEVHSTRYARQAEPVTPRRTSSRQRRLMRNGAERYNVSLVS